ncbi:hypothetical protein BG011_004776, partial [Mortierella polycephala]
MEGRHGQKKEVAKSPEAIKARQDKEAVLVREYIELKESLKEIVDSKKWDNDALRTTAALLRKSPDYYTIWNVRRTILNEGFLKNA